MISIHILAFALAMPAAQPVTQSVVETRAAESHGSFLKDDPIKRGAPIGASPAIALDDVLKNPKRFSDSLITIEGFTNSVCPKKGCWMEISSKKGGKGVRVTFKDYAFFVPTDSKGMKVRAEGRIVVTTLSREDVEHLVGEGAQIDANPDGTATEVAFVAEGVELRKK